MDSIHVSYGGSVLYEPSWFCLAAHGFSLPFCGYGGEVGTRVGAKVSRQEDNNLKNLKNLRNLSTYGTGNVSKQLATTIKPASENL